MSRIRMLVEVERLVPLMYNMTEGNEMARMFMDIMLTNMQLKIASLRIVVGLLEKVNGNYLQHYIMWQLAVIPFLNDNTMYFNQFNDYICIICAGSTVVRLTDLINAPEMDKLFKATENFPELMVVLLNGVNYLMVNPDKVIIIQNNNISNRMPVIMKLCNKAQDSMILI